MTIRISRSWQAGTSRLNPALGHWPKDSGFRVWAILVLVAVLIQGFAVWDVLAATPGDPLRNTGAGPHRLVPPVTPGDQGLEFVEAGLGEESRFVAHLAAAVVETLRATPPAGLERRSRFHSILNHYFDLSALARPILGRHWRLASAADRRAFVRLLHEHVTDLYLAQFRNFDGEEIQILRARVIDADFSVVQTEIVHPARPDRQIDFWVRRAPDGYRVLDVVVEGTSLLVTKRAEFQAVIEREGLRGLMQRLERMTAAAQVPEG